MHRAASRDLICGRHCSSGAVCLDICLLLWTEGGLIESFSLQLQVAVGMEVEDINAHLTRLDGVEMLEKLRKQGRLTELLQPALPVSAEAAAAAASAGRDPQPALTAVSKSAAAGGGGCSVGTAAA